MFSNRLSVSHGCSLMVTAMAVGAIAMFAVGNARANLILNGDFSANASSYTTYPGYSVSPNPSNPTDWTIGGIISSLDNAGINGTGPGFEPFAPSSSDMADMAFLQGQGTNISQIIATTAGQEYMLSYDAAARQGETSDVMNAIVMNEADSTQIAVQIPAISDAQFTQFSLNFVAPSASTTVEFLNQTANSATAGGYSVDVSGVSLIAVPEPTTLVLVAIGGAGLLLMCRKRAARHNV